MSTQGTIAAPGIGASQRTMLETIKRLGEATLAEVVQTVDIAPETVRSHMLTLVAQGLVIRTGVKRDGPGRPRVCFALSDAGNALFPQKDRELLRELATFLSVNGHGALLERFFSDRLKKKRAAAEAQIGHLPPKRRLAALAKLLTNDGFIAEVVTARGKQQLRLCHCPLRELVEISDLPCRAEQSLISHVLGVPVQLQSFMPDGAPLCTYAIGSDSRNSKKSIQKKSR